MGGQTDALAPVRGALDFVARVRDTVEVVRVEQAAQEYGMGAALILDLREPEEWAAGHIRGAVHLPRGELEFKADPTWPSYEARIATKPRILVLCAKGLRSILAAATLREMGYERVASIEGGFQAWRAAGRPVERDGELQEAQA